MFKPFIVFILYVIISIGASYANFKLIMSDSIASFFDSKKEIKHYSSIPFYQLDLYNEQLVDYKQLKQSIKRFEKYCKIMNENGYNSISLDDLNHLIVFKKSGYYKNTQLEKRNLIYKKYYKNLIKIAKKNNLNVYIISDMQFYTSILEKKFKKINIENSRKINKEAFEELFTDFPEISGVIIRIGEGGASYNFGDYKSKILYKNPKQVNNLLKELLKIFKRYNKILIFRTWTIGIGKVGDLIINKKTYDKVFSGITSDNLIVSIKHTPGDFFYFDKLNPLIGYGKLKQIVEIQTRREYEGAGDFPNYFGEEYLNIIKKIKINKNVIGVWNWNQTGGWGYGKKALFNFGFNFYNEINFFVASKILKNSNVKNTDKYLTEVLGKYNFTKEEKKVLFNILKNSRNIIKYGFYINDFRTKLYKINGIYIPPLLRIWWDQVTSSPIILSLIYNSLDNKLKTIEESSYFLAIQKKELEAFKKVMQHNNTLSKEIYFSLQNRFYIFKILHLYKTSFINYFLIGKKTGKKEIFKWIKKYNTFLKKHPNFNFDFSEISKFYITDLSKNLFFYGNLIAFLILLLLYFYHKTSIFNKGGMIIFIINILFLFISPFFFLSTYNFYWLLFRIHSIFLILFLFYFFILAKILSYFYKEKIKFKKGVGKLINILFPFILIGEMVIIVSFIFGESFFWKIITLGYEKTYVKWLLFLLILFYLIIFFYQFLRFSNILIILSKSKYKNLLTFYTFTILIIYLIFMIKLDPLKLEIIDTFSYLFPKYFKIAGSGIKF